MSRSDRKEAEAFRERAAADLRHLAEVLEEANITPDAGPLKQAAGQVGKPPSELGWRYSVTDLRFNVDLPRNSLPAGLSGPLTISLHVQARGEVPCLPHDPFTELAVDIALNVNPHAGQALLCTWHFDRHITGGQNEPEEAHPLYHFQYGGRGMQSVSAQLGQTLLLEGPRLPHPPLDAVLAVDFVLAHYAGGVRNGLVEVERYKRVVKETQRRLWEPYQQMLAQTWHPEADRGQLRLLTPTAILLEPEPALTAQAKKAGKR